MIAWACDLMAVNSGSAALLCAAAMSRVGWEQHTSLQDGGKEVNSGTMRTGNKAFLLESVDLFTSTLEGQAEARGSMALWMVRDCS